jgi:mitotic spindle assembly checkpoint protein MAD2
VHRGWKCFLWIDKSIDSFLYRDDKRDNGNTYFCVCVCVFFLMYFFSSNECTGIYQPETFKRESKYGLTVLTTTDDGLLKYLAQVMAQVESWLLNGDVQRLVVVVSGVDSGETLERWQFNVALDAEDNNNGEGVASGEENQRPNNTNTESKKNKNNNPPTKKNNNNKKTMKEIHGEIQAIIRQITASVTFLPLLNEPCSFDLLVYTKKEAAVPKKWEDSDPCYIMNSQEVKLRSFTTSVSTCSVHSILVFLFELN